MKLTVVFPVLNQFELSRVAIENAIRNLSGETDTDILILDNASDVPFPYWKSRDERGVWVPIPTPSLIATKADDEKVPDHTVDRKAFVRLVRLEKNIGVYPVFWEVLKQTKADVIAVFHSDLIITEKDWDKHVLFQFERFPQLGLLGFIGSNEIDAAGGRGLGTTSNFQGDSFHSRNERGEDKTWSGSHARIHGAVNAGFTNAAVVDGCAMIFRRDVLEAIPQRENQPPHHFYDKLLSCETREKGYTVGVLGVACDHISGQTVNQENAYSVMAEAWAKAHGFTMESVGAHNWDTVLYRIAESQWLAEYRDVKHLVPCKV